VKSRERIKMFKLKNPLVALMLMTLSGCGSLTTSDEDIKVKIVTEYEDRIILNSQKLVKTIDEALSYNKKIVVIPDKKAKFRLSNKNKILKDDESVSYFEIFLLKAEEMKVYEVTIKSYHRGGVGSGMTIVIPQIYLVDSRGEGMYLTPAFEKGNIPAFGPYRFTTKWRLPEPIGKEQVFVVKAKTKNLGEKANSIKMKLGVLTPEIIPYDFYSDFTGKLDIEINEI
jgi:hypothetical protein